MQQRSPWGCCVSGPGRSESGDRGVLVPVHQPQGVGACWRGGLGVALRECGTGWVLTRLCSRTPGCGCSPHGKGTEPGGGARTPRLRGGLTHAAGRSDGQRSRAASSTDGGVGRGREAPCSPRSEKSLSTAGAAGSGWGPAGLHPPKRRAGKERARCRGASVLGTGSPGELWFVRHWVLRPARASPCPAVPHSIARLPLGLRRGHIPDKSLGGTPTPGRHRDKCPSPQLGALDWTGERGGFSLLPCDKRTGVSAQYGSSLGKGLYNPPIP